MRAFRVPAVIALAASAVAGAVTAVAATGTRSHFDDLAIALAITTYAVVGVAVELARPGHPVGRTMLAGALGWGVGEGLLELAIAGIEEGDASTGEAVLGVLGTTARGLGWLLLVLLLPLLFPDGRVESRWSRRLVTAALVLYGLGLLLAPVPLEDRLSSIDNPWGLGGAWRPLADGLALGGVALAAAGLVAAVRGLVGKWRHGGSLMRQQLLGFAAAFSLPLLVVLLAASPFIRPWMFAVATIPVPVAVAVAMFQRRLYDVQLAVSRTLTYLALTAVLAGVYAFVVGGVGVILRDRGNEWLPWAAAGIVAVAFAPLRESLQGAVNRLTYGRWASPAEVLADTGRRLADAADAGNLLRSLTTELVDGLGLSYASISDLSGRRLASSGQLDGDPVRTPLTAYGHEVGTLEWSGHGLRDSDRDLLHQVANQIGAAVHTVGLVDALRAAQERLVLASEQERRRLRGDLHDGLGPALAGLGLQLDAVINIVEAGGSVDDRLTRLRAGLTETVAEVRRIVEGLRPAVVDDLGLFGAVAELGHQLVEGAGLDLSLELPSGRPSLPAAVEVTAYRVAQEALTNVVRHAQASRCRVAGSVSGDVLVLEVSDDGRGGAAPRDGLGIPGMSERAGQIGGRVEIASGSPGTVVTMRLPLVEGASA